MAKKSMIEAATAGTSIFDQIVNGAVSDVQNTKDTQDVQNTQDAIQKEPTVPMARLNLKLPEELKYYLQAAAYKASTPKHIVSVTEYLCALIRKDMEANKPAQNEEK